MPAVGLDLGFAGAAEEAEAAALPLEVGPAAHQPPRLIIEMGELDLQAPFGGRRPLAENLEDQPGAVDHLGAGLVLEVLLLDRGQRRIDDQQPRLIARRRARRSPRPAPCRAGSPGGRCAPGTRALRDVDADRLRQALPPPRAALRPNGATPSRGELGHDQDRAFAAGDLDRSIAVERVQDVLLRCARPPSPLVRSRSSAFAGCSVEIACL